MPAAHPSLVGLVSRQPQKRSAQDNAGRVGDCVIGPQVPIAKRSIHCTVRELLPAAVACDPNALRTPVRDAMGNAMMVGDRAWCATEQVGVDTDGRPVGVPGHAIGWFYDVQSGGCAQRVAYAPGSEPALGTLVRIECAAP